MTAVGKRVVPPTAKTHNPTARQGQIGVLDTATRGIPQRVLEELGKAATEDL